MGTETFLRLPEEKRNRFLSAAWEEFTSVPMDKVSVNRIVNRAGIPRGSFYQYFVDKSDLMYFLTDRFRERVVNILSELCRQGDRDPFRLTLMAYDHFTDQRRGRESPFLDRWVRFIRTNPGINLESIFRESQDGRLRGAYLREIDRSRFLEEGDDFALEVGCLLGMCLGNALMECLHDSSRRERAREELQVKLDIIQRGSLREESAAEGGTRE